MWRIEADFDRDNTFAYDLTEYVKSFKCRLGMRDAYQLMADESTMTLKVENSEGHFNPENASGAFYNLPMLHSRVRVVAERSGGDAILWIGWLKEILPSQQLAGANTGKTVAQLECVGAKMLLDAITVDLGVYTDVTGDVVVADVLQQSVIPPAVAGVWLAEIPGSSEAGITTFAGDTAAYSDIETGRTTFSTLVNDNSKGYDAIRLVTEGERGRFFFDREGKAIWWNRHHLLSTTTSEAEVDMVGEFRPAAVDYQYNADRIKNIVRVNLSQRSTAASETLWSLQNPITIPANATMEFDVSLLDAGGEPVAVASLSTANVTYSAGTASISVEAAGTRARVTIENSAATPATLTGLDITGAPIQDRNRMVGIASDTTSIGRYGRRELDLTLRALETLEQAANVAQFELLRRKDARSQVGYLDFVNEADDSANAHQLDWTIGARLTVTLNNGHEADHYVIGEQHDVTLPGVDSVHKTRFFLEPALAGQFWLAEVAGYSEAGQTTYGGY